MRTTFSRPIRAALPICGIAAIVALAMTLLSGQFVPGSIGTCTTVQAPATLTSTSGYALTVTATGNDADNEGIFIHQSATGALVYGIHVLADGAATSEYATKIGCTNAGTCTSLQTDAGNVVFNSQSGTFQDNGSAVFQGSNLTIGLGGTANTIVVEKHNSAPTPTSCGTGATATGSNFAVTITTGTSATACTVTFSSGGFGAAPTCTVTARTGTNQAGLAFTTSATVLTLSAAAASAVYDAICVGH